MSVKKEKVLITGASSYVGARIYSDLKSVFDVVGTYHTNNLFPELIKLDITDKNEVLKVTKEVRPDYIVHVAANPNGRAVDADPSAARELNELGTKHLVDAANEIGVKIIYISSFAAINPSNLYGETKLHGEEYVRNTKAGWVILRPSLIIGLSQNITNDRPFNRILKNITEKTPAVYDNNWQFQVTSLNHLSRIVRSVIEKEIFNEIIPVASEELVTRYMIARDILQPFGISAEIAPEKDNSPIFKEDLIKLRDLDLPTYKYQEVIDLIITELKKTLS